MPSIILQASLAGLLRTIADSKLYGADVWVASYNFSPENKRLSRLAPELWVANYNFRSENRCFGSLAPDGVLPYACPAQRTSPRDCQFAMHALFLIERVRPGCLQRSFQGGGLVVTERLLVTLFLAAFLFLGARSHPSIPAFFQTRHVFL